MYWTLKYEWLFYLTLPFIAWAYRDTAFSVLVLSTTALLFKFSLNIVLLSFVFGAVTAWLLDKNIQWLSRWAQSTLAALAVAMILVLIFWRMNTAYTVLASVMLFVLFFIVAAGNSLFGLLVSKPARLLGAMNYSIYLLHSPILFLLLYWVNLSISVARLSALNYWGLMSMAGIVLVLVASMTFRWVEYPFMPQRRAVVFH
ncbi:transposon-related protein [Sulfuriferula multivorans]|uniref:Transposon-related protein n=1 Tax=Sulfuriferula multivorans TaxID=1559896 RepID=A0A401JGV1_9PROT|nr:transposon-related protein [Sulfuriferula multivorans]